MAPSRILAGIVLSVLSACSAQADSNPEFAVADSAGVQIVSNAAVEEAPGITEEEEGGNWTVDMEPSVVIGAQSGEPEELLYYVSGARRFRDGRIVVANAGTSELRFFDSQGRYLKSVGRQGEGPGEFREVSRIQVTHLDSLLVWDQSSRRISVFDEEGSFVRSFMTPSFRDFPTTPVGVFSDGTIAFRTLTVYPEGDERTGVTRDPVHYVRVDSRGSILNEIGSFPGNEVYRPSGESEYVIFSLPLLRTTREAVSGMDLIVGTAHTFEVQVYGSEGVSKRLVRWEGSIDPITQEDIEEVIAARLGRARDEAQRLDWAELLQTAQFPEVLPAYGNVVADVRGNIWVEEYQSPDLSRTEEGRVHWSVFSPEGKWYSDIELPTSLFVTEIGENFVLGIRRDELGVERVELYTLRTMN